jgi:carbon starvation protein
MFPMLFITVACGAISGFHSLVGSGTTAKQLDREKDAKLIGYGGMLIECGLAVIAIIGVGTLFAEGALPGTSPPVTFATAVANFTTAIGIPFDIAFTIITLSISAFALTSLDTATRLGRYMFQELFVNEGDDPAKLTGIAKLAANKYTSTAITVVVGGALAFGGYQNIWPLFGSANQLLAALSLLAVSVWLGNVGRNNKMFHIPMAFMLLATLTALVITITKNVGALASGSGTFVKEGLQVIFAVLLFVLAVFLAVEGIMTLLGKNVEGGGKRSRAAA